MDEGYLNSVIEGFKGGMPYELAISGLTENFVDFGEGGMTGTINQAGTTKVGEFVFNNPRIVNVNGVSDYYNTPLGTISGVTWSFFGPDPKKFYLWTAFNNEIALVRNADGTGTTNWTMPSSDFSNLVLNTDTINNQSEVLIGTYVAPQVGSIGFIQTVAPEPSSLSLLLAGGAVLMAGRRRKV